MDNCPKCNSRLIFNRCEIEEEVDNVVYNFTFYVCKECKNGVMELDYYYEKERNLSINKKSKQKDSEYELER